MTDVPTNYEGPVCNLNSKSEILQPTAPSGPPIPIATDLASGLQAINALANIIRQMIGDTSGPNNFFFGGPPGGGGGGNNPTKKPAKLGDFVEIPGTRVTKKVRIYNPDDDSQFVDVEQVEHVQFANKFKQKLTYSN